MTVIKTIRRYLRPVKKAYRSSLPTILSPFNVTTSTIVGAQRFRVPLMRGVGLNNVWGSEPWMTDLLQRLQALIRNHGLIDVGVNIGQTLLKLKSIDSAAMYLGFEPNPLCVVYVNELVRCNSFENCEIYPVALSNSPAVHRLILDNEEDPGGTMITDLRPRKRSSRSQYIASLVFDDMNINVGDADLVKIDVEGAELQVLLGMRKFLNSRRPLIVCEVLHADNAGKVENLARRNKGIIDLLQNADYDIFRLIKGTNCIQAIETVATFPDEVWTYESYAVCDYLMVPKERVKETSREFPIRNQ
jgi:FkbM family methyltransferase